MYGLYLIGVCLGFCWLFGMEFDHIAFESFGRLHVVTGVDFKRPGQRVIIYSGSLLLSRALSTFIHYLHVSTEPIPHARQHFSPTHKNNSDSLGLGLYT